MKISSLIISIVVLSIQTIAQSNSPKLVGIVMIGKSSKPILDFYIVDSTRKDEYKFDVHTIVLFAGKSTLGNIYSSFQNEKKYDSLTKYDYSFGTFLFVCRFENNEKLKVINTRIQSIELFKRIMGTLSSSDRNEALIIKEIDENLLQRINY